MLFLLVCTRSTKEPGVVLLRSTRMMPAPALPFTGFRYTAGKRASMASRSAGPDIRRVDGTYLRVCFDLLSHSNRVHL
ncbi:hypothetical protein D3C75_774940 [compost metagenome]